jgi:hypothetical protein
LSGVELDDEDLEEVEKLEELESAKELDLWTRVKKAIFDLVQRMGFFGILVCASVILHRIYTYPRVNIALFHIASLMPDNRVPHAWVVQQVISSCISTVKS